MKYFKTQTNEIHAFDDDAPAHIAESAIKERGLVEISEVEASAILAPNEEERKAQKIATLDADYQNQKTNLIAQFNDALIHGEETVEISASMSALDAWYDEEYQKIEGEA